MARKPKSADIVPLKTRRQAEEVEHLQYVLALPDIEDSTREDLSRRLATVEPDPAPWTFIMANPERHREVLRTINESSRPLANLRTYHAALTYARFGTNEIGATVPEIANTAGVSVREAYRALKDLAELGALVRTGRGKYALNAENAFRGQTTERLAVVAEQAETRRQHAVQLSLIDGGKP